MVEVRPDGSMQNAFGDERTLRAFATGYGCGNCCAMFRTFLLECPVCKQPTDVSGWATTAPEGWQEHVDARSTAAPTARRTFDDAMGQVLADSDVENVKLSQLKKSRHGAG